MPSGNAVVPAAHMAAQMVIRIIDKHMQPIVTFAEPNELLSAKQTAADHLAMDVSKLRLEHKGKEVYVAHVDDDDDLAAIIRDIDEGILENITCPITVGQLLRV